MARDDGGASRTKLNIARRLPREREDVAVCNVGIYTCAYEKFVTVYGWERENRVFFARGFLFSEMKMAEGKNA